MKIAIFSSTISPTDGYGNITYELCQALYSRGINFTLFLPKDQKRKNDYSFEIRYELPRYIYRIKTPHFLCYFKNIDLRGFTLVHSLFDFPYCWLAARLAKKYNLPFIMGAQGTYGVLPLTYWPEKYFLEFAYSNAKIILAPSQFTKNKILEFSHYKNLPIEILHNGVNFERFNKELESEALQSKYAGKKILLTVGGLKPRKGQDLVIKALPQIIKNEPDIKYLIIGGGGWISHLKNLVQEFNLENYVDFLGVVRDDELVKYFQLCGIYIHTPRVENLNFEGFGIVYLEAGAAGKPIVATDAGGIKDAVIDRKTGLIVQDGDIVGIADAVINILQNPELKVQLAKNGLEYAKKHKWPDIADQFINYYLKFTC